MNYRCVIQHLGRLMLILSISVLAVASWSALRWYRTGGSDAAAPLAMLACAATGFVTGGLLWFLARRDPGNLRQREALLLVSLAWVLGAALSALPFFLWAHIDPAVPASHPFTSFVDCYFEAMSGLTTTGATVLGSPGSLIEEIPPPLLLWRSLTQWLGGLGIVVLFVAVLPTLGVGGKKLFQAETSGPLASGVRPRIRETARVLWLIYLGMTLLLIAALCAAGSNPFDAVCHTFATVSSAGFSTRDTSIAHFTTPQQVIIAVFMVLAGINFGVFHLFISGRYRQALADKELRFYLTVLLLASIAVTLSLVRPQFAAGADPAAIAATVRDGLVQTISIQTSTGFCVTDFDRWEFLPKAILFAGMFIGASAGSTGGGIKVIRILIAVKVCVAEIERVFRPNVVRPFKIGGSPVDSQMRLTTMVYVLTILALFVAGTMTLMLLEGGGRCNLTTAAAATAATLNNIGPGFGAVGAAENYGWFSMPSKLVLTALMALGRLELYALLVLFTPRFWRTQ